MTTASACADPAVSVSRIITPALAVAVADHADARGEPSVAAKRGGEEHEAVAGPLDALPSATTIAWPRETAAPPVAARSTMPSLLKSAATRLPFGAVLRRICGMLAYCRSADQDTTNAENRTRHRHDRPTSVASTLLGRAGVRRPDAAFMPAVNGISAASHEPNASFVKTVTESANRARSRGRGVTVPPRPCVAKSRRLAIRAQRPSLLG